MVFHNTVGSTHCLWDCHECMGRSLFYTEFHYMPISLTHSAIGRLFTLFTAYGHNKKVHVCTFLCTFKEWNHRVVGHMEVKRLVPLAKVHSVKIHQSQYPRTFPQI